MDRITGLPAHPLVVHIPVAFLPLAAVGVIIMLIRRAWYERYRWAVLAVAAIGTMGAIIATSTGEGLEEAVGEAEGRAAVRAVHDHAEAGDLARTSAILFFVVLAAWVIVPWFLERRAARADAPSADAPSADAPSADAPSGEARSVGSGWLRPVLMAATALAAVFSMVTVIEAGHSGASRAWEDFDTSPSAEVGD